MRQLIVNADDLGADEERNAGIFEAIGAGSVTSFSILANGPALGDALKRIRALDPGSVSFGIHLNLSEGKPVTPGLRCISGPDGCFKGKASTQSMLSEREDAELEREIRTELSAQIGLILDSGISLDHMDGHQHVHVLPAVASAAAEIAGRHGIHWVRIPDEPVPDYPVKFMNFQVRDEALFFSRSAENARAVYRAAGLKTTDHFRGLYLKGQLPAENWAHFLEALPSGITELMVHPGLFSCSNSGPFAGFLTQDRMRELAALTDGRFTAGLLRTGVRLIRFPDNQN